MRASELIRGLPIEALEQDFEVTGVTHDSRRVRSGDLFVALVGDRFDGRAFVAQARARGAAGVLSVGDPPADYDGPWLRAGDPRAAMGLLAARLHDHPDRDLVMVGVTGTNGKSTVIALVASMLEAAGRPTGTVGTLGHRFEDLAIEAGRTTPEATDLFPLLHDIVERGGQAVVMEVSSHALVLDRAAGVGFDVAAFTNLSRDHFDFHGGFEEYFAAKRRLFEQLKPEGRAVLNVDDPYGRRLADDLGARGVRLTTFGERDGDVSVVEAALSIEGIGATLRTPRGELSVSSRLRGRLNLLNLSAAVACGEALELDAEAVIAGLERLGPVAGRLEPVDRGQPFPVFIDFAHTDAALAASLRSLREIAAGRKIACVFGCGGDRDPGKRVLMGRAAGELADLPIVTSDNPRREDPLAIIAAVEEGLEQSGNDSYRVIPDRREAIARAISIADEDWLVLVAGKGHEEGQIIGDEIRPFSDREELIMALEARLG
ncbi:MAG: UDP-N-acetylmuramoyl-L-alanyl-D-glutamate--2,6-diaminopimelate ligase [bacterium]|nr:UDP-N-acetylmuramoyl-L-alanyl-D-glutamate--2,6-diaminopimelate ligase [bacterium]